MGSVDLDMPCSMVCVVNWITPGNSFVTQVKYVEMKANVCRTEKYESHRSEKLWRQ